MTIENEPRWERDYEAEFHPEPKWMEPSEDTDLSGFTSYAPHPADGEYPFAPAAESGSLGRSEGQPPHERVLALLEAEDSEIDFATFYACTPDPVEEAERVWPAMPAKTSDSTGPDISGASQEVLIACSLEPQNDTGNGKRLLHHFGNELLFVHNVGWHTWTTSHWEGERGLEAATRYAQETAARIRLEADVLAPSSLEREAIETGGSARGTKRSIERAKNAAEARKDPLWQNAARAVEAADTAVAALEARKVARRKYSVSSGNAGKLRGMLDQAAVHRTVSIEALDANGLTFNVQNGTIHFVRDEEPDPDASDHSGNVLKRWRIELRPHDRTAMITKVAPVEFNPEADCPRFLASIERFQPTLAVRQFLQRYHGYALTGLTGEQCLVFNYGNGANWKSTFVETIARIMGPYAQTIPFESVSGDVQKSGSQASPEFARLPGARLVRASEPDHNVQFKEGLLKTLTSGEPMLTRANFKDFFEFHPEFKLVFSGNHKPKIAGGDHGIWRRIHMVPWQVKIEPHERRPMGEVMDELKPERSGILNWLLAGTVDYLNQGLSPPPEVINATAAYQEEMDLVGAFVSMCVKLAPSNGESERAFIPARHMYVAFDTWCFANGITAWKERTFAKAMTDKGFEKLKHESGMRYMDVRLHNVPERPRGSRHGGDDDIVPA